MCGFIVEPKSYAVLPKKELKSDTETMLLEKYI